jgi:hypothetical protein
MKKMPRNLWYISWETIRDGNNRDPVLFRSMRLGNRARTYVQVHISRRRTSKSDWKLKRAD